MKLKWNPFIGNFDYVGDTTGGGGTVPSNVATVTHVVNYSALPDPTTISLTDIYICDNSQGTSWLPGSLGGTYYNKGVYLSNGTSWVYSSTPYQATQAEVNTGTNTDKFVTPDTFTNSTKWDNYQNKSNSLVFVYTINDLPPTSSNIITLASNTTYFFTNVLDLVGNRLICGENTTIIGGSSENCRIKSTGLIGTAMITSNYSLPMRNITLEANNAILLIGDGSTTALDWFGVNFTNCATVGVIADYTNVIISDSAFLNSGGLTFDGTIGTIGISQSLFDCNTANTVFILPDTLTISRRFRIIYSSFVVLSGETGINVNVSATISTESYILDTVNFSGGGTYLTGVSNTSNDSLFINCVGINNTAVNGQLYMQANATATTVSATNTFYKVAGTTTASADNSKFSHSNNRLTCNAVIIRKYLIQANLSFTSGNNNVCEFGFYDSQLATVRTPSKTKATANGSGRAENASFFCVVTMGLNDYIEIHASNTSSITNITVDQLNFTITEIK